MRHDTLLLSIVLTTPLLNAQEWNRLRGPAGQGIGEADALPAKLGAENVRWRVPSGSGHSSPVLWKDSLFLTRLGKRHGTREVVCLDANSGVEKWATPCEFEPHRQHKLNSFASATPAVDGRGIYIAWTSGSKLVAEAFRHDGKRAWRRELGAFRAQHGSGASPILHAGKLIVANENEGDESFLTALDENSGKTIWRLERRSHPQRGAYSCPVVYHPARGAPYLLFTSTAHGLTAVDPETGEVLWAIDPKFKQRCVNVPVVMADLVFYSAGAGNAGRECAFVRVPRERGGEPEIVRGLRRAIPYVPAGLSLGKHLYTFADGGIASCIRIADGEVVWRKRVDGTFFSSPVSNGKTIYIASREGTLFSFAAGKRFAVLGTFELGDKVHATPAIARGRMYVRTFHELLCFEVATGAASARRKTGEPRKQRPEKKTGEG